jgi:hypothetical protein
MPAFAVIQKCKVMPSSEARPLILADRSQTVGVDESVHAQFGAIVSYLDAHPLRVLTSKREKRALLGLVRDHVTRRIDSIDSR